MSSVQTKIAKESFICNGDLILKSITDKAGNDLRSQISLWLNNNYIFQDITRTKRHGIVAWNGFNATDINKRLREKMNIVSGIHGESCVEYDSILSKGKKGFDFSLYDEEYYIKRLRNAFIGYPGRFNGDKELKELYARVKNSNDKAYTKTNWIKKIASLGGSPGTNIDILGKNYYTVVGEIQFGNWALVRHDLIRLLNSERDGEIDFYIYITSTGTLESKLSEGTVTYDSVMEFLNENLRLIHTPMWIIGLDVL